MKLRKYKVSSEKKKIGSQKHQQPTQKIEKPFFCILEKSILKFFFLVRGDTITLPFDGSKYTTSSQKKKLVSKNTWYPLITLKNRFFVYLGLPSKKSAPDK